MLGCAALIENKTAGRSPTTRYALRQTKVPGQIRGIAEWRETSIPTLNRRTFISHRSGTTGLTRWLHSFVGKLDGEILKGALRHACLTGPSTRSQNIHRNLGSCRRICSLRRTASQLLAPGHRFALWAEQRRRLQPLRAKLKSLMPQQSCRARPSLSRRICWRAIYSPPAAAAANGL